MLRVIKRDNRIKPFDFERVSNAIKMAYQDVYKQTFKETAVRLEMCNVIYSAENIFDAMNDDTPISVENIQDIVIAVLNNYNEDVAKAYSGYREERTRVRESKTRLLNSINKIIDNTNTAVLNENSNKQSQLESTKRDLIAGEVSKTVARQMIPQHLLDAHDDGLIKIHDLDYYMQNIYNCELVNLKEMLQNGTVINKKMIRKPKSLRTAMTLATQIAAQVASSTYGGQTMSLAHLAPFVRISYEKITKKYKAMNLPITPERLDVLVNEELRAEIKDSVQTFNYQISTIMTTNGQAPFISLCMYLNEEPGYEMETALLIEEFFRQRIEGMENEYGVKSTQTFPKLLYFLDENNIHDDSEYYWLTQLAVKCTALRMNPDYISVKKMKEIIGHVFPPMGCRAFLSPFQDENGEWIFYGRGNLGAQSINLPYVALLSGGDINKFWDILDDTMELIRQMGELRYEKLRGVKADSAPILWQHGAISRLEYNEDITKAIDARGFTVAMGYSGIYEAVKYLTGHTHTDEVGFKLAEEIMRRLRGACDTFKKNQPHLRFALYGTPQESTTGWFSERLRKKFGDIEDITDKGWITNSYHVDIREEIDAFSKLSIESKLQAYSTGGAVSYIETISMNKNLEALMDIIKFQYEEILYSEINFESDVCGVCKYEGVMDNDPKTLNWICPQCGNDDQKTLSVVRRTCGYLGETSWTDGRKLDIINRVKHI